jgi:hypothetical protein
MRVGAALAILCLFTACTRDGASIFRQYEYEEEMYLGLDGSATLFVNSSVPALTLLRGAPFDPRPNARIDRNRVREYFTSPGVRVTRVSLTRRHNRRFVHIRLDVDDVRRLDAAAPFAWSSYRLSEDEDVATFRQEIGAPAAGDSGATRWTGRELVAFRLHLPSRVLFHNAGEGNLRRGNILVWEQTLEQRLHGERLTLEARMGTRSILFTTLLLFGATGLAVAAMFGIILWRLLRQGASPAASGAG